MAGEPVVNIGENSPEGVAYKLFQTIYLLEKPKGRKEILDTFAECLLAVHHPERRTRSD
jgi:hypothetical protein